MENFRFRIAQHLYCILQMRRKRWYYKWEGLEGQISLLQLEFFFHNVESPFLVDHYIEIDKDHYYKNHNVKKNVKRTSKVSVLSDFHILTATYECVKNRFMQNCRK